MLIKKIFSIIIILFSVNFSYADFELGEKGKVNFETFYTFDLSSLYKDKYLERPLKGKGRLYLPKNINEKKVPLIIILHTSGGVKGNREIRYANFFKKLGYAAFVVNTYGTRKCNPSGDSGPWKNCISKITTVDFATDAYSALNKLTLHPNIDKNKVGVIGFSYGANATALILDSKVKEKLSPDNSFLFNIAVYGDCFLNYADLTNTTKADFHFIIGTRDKQYNKEICDKNFQKISDAGSIVNQYFLEGGVHIFDADYPVEWLPSSEYPTFTNCDLQFYNDGTYLESKTNTKLKMDAEEDLKTKYKKRKKFVFSTIKKCYGKGNYIGSQKKVMKKNLQLLEDIMLIYF